MLIGNRRRLAFEFVPVEPSWQRRYAPEQTAWAGLAIWVDGRNLNAHRRSGEERTREHLFVPLAPIADWLVRVAPALAYEERVPHLPTQSPLHRLVREWGEKTPPSGLDEAGWLAEREAFWSRHFLLAAADGARLPNLALLRADDEVLCSWTDPGYQGETPVRFLEAEGGATIEWRELQTAACDLVGYVAEALRAADLLGHFPWAREADPFQAALDAAPDAVALYCGRSLADLAELFQVESHALLDVLELPSAAQPDQSPICQVLRDLSPHPPQSVAEDLRARIQDSRGAPASARSTWLDLRDQVRSASSPARPEHQGQGGAQALRDLLGLDGKPIGDLDQVVEGCGVAVRDRDIDTGLERMLVLAAAGGAAVGSVFRTRRTVSRWARRFERARALGHALLDPLRADALGAASSEYAQELRRRRSGAFAAELLLPWEAIARAGGGSLDAAARPDVFPDLLAEYGIGATAAAWQLFHHGCLSSAEIRDDLISEYGRGE